MANPAQPWEDGGEGNPMRGREEEASVVVERSIRLSLGEEGKGSLPPFFPRPAKY